MDRLAMDAAESDALLTRVGAFGCGKVRAIAPANSNPNRYG
jgi:hypothetical protein